MCNSPKSNLRLRYEAVTADFVFFTHVCHCETDDEHAHCRTTDFTGGITVISIIIIIFITIIFSFLVLNLC